ncbi:chloride channel protein [Planctomycetota bacterium]|nr:chloride channel protein [Planctomycetota bacterium]
MARFIRLKNKFHRTMVAAGFQRDWFLIPLAALIGCFAGLVATGFDHMVTTSSDFFFGKIDGTTNITLRYALLMTLPAIGGLLVGCIQQFIARQKASHGVPEVMVAMARKHGDIPLKTGIFKAINASLTIGSGGSAGEEGPVIQIGAVAGSFIARTAKVSREHMATLTGCGAAAGLAGIFNAPISGAIFVLEVMLRDFSMKSFIPIMIATVFGVTTSQLLLGGAEGGEAIFNVPAALKDYDLQAIEIIPYLFLGIGCGLIGVIYAKGMGFTENLFEKVKTAPFVKPAIGGLCVGLMGIVFAYSFHRPFDKVYEPPAFYSNGYPVVEATLNPDSYRYEEYKAELEKTAKAAEKAGKPLTAEEATPVSPQEYPTVTTHNYPVGNVTLMLLLAACFAKIVGTCLTLGSGGSGGIFAPSLFIGATLGGAFGIALQQIGILPSATPAPFALAGMAGVLAGAVRCPLTAFLLVFEITQDYKLILPTMLVAVLATLCAQFFVRDSIYTAQLRHLGLRMGSMSDMTVLRRLEVIDVPPVPAVVVNPNEPATRLLELANTCAATDFVVVDENNKYLGMIIGHDVRTTLLQQEAIPLMICGELMHAEIPTIHHRDTLDLVLDKFSQYDTATFAVTDQNNTVKGVLTRARLLKKYQNALDEPG